MAGDALAAVEDLDRSIGHPGPELLSQQAMWHRVVMLVDLDVVIETGAAFLPCGVGIGLDGQGRERRALEILEQLATAGTEMARGAAVELLEEIADGDVGLGQREEPPVPEPSQD